MDAPIDFRSDTVTQPTAEMREAMAAAEVGDDVYGEDPTVNRLQRRAAELTGKQAGLFVASGTMGNLTAILTHAGRGDEAIVGADAHTILWEAGGMAALGGIVPHLLPTDDRGRMDPQAVEAAVREDDPHLPRSRLVLLENSYGARDGHPLPAAYAAAVRRVAARHDLAVHLDGARLFNAAIALGVSAAELTRDVDSVTFCLSKGLCAPVGSVLCGTEAFIGRARRVRKQLGGGMRQAGVLAAAGLVALERMIGRLADDHRRARRLAEGLAAVPGVLLRPDRVLTNIIFFRLAADAGVDAATLARRLRDELGVLVGAHGDELRAVTHAWIGDADVSALVEGVAALLADGA